LTWVAFPFLALSTASSSSSNIISSSTTCTTVVGYTSSTRIPLTSDFGVHFLLLTRHDRAGFKPALSYTHTLYSLETTERSTTLGTSLFIRSSADQDHEGPGLTRVSYELFWKLSGSLPRLIIGRNEKLMEDGWREG
jgi:hypothetical protein